MRRILAVWRRCRRAGNAAARGAGFTLVAAMMAASSVAVADTDDGFPAFLAHWRQAVARDDAAALAALAQTPFLFDGRLHDEAGVAGEVVPALLTDDVRRCLSSAVPVREDDRRVLFCAPYAFHLGRVDGRWRWVEFAADGEP